MSSERQDDGLRLATFNLKHGAFADGYRGNPKLVAETCRALDADILALQEVDQGVMRSGRADLARLAAEASGMQAVFEPTMKFRIGHYGNALLVRGEIDNYDVRDLGGIGRFRIAGHRFSRPLEPRNAILASVAIGERQFSVAATHLSTVRSVSEYQLDELLDNLTEMPEPHILLGDLNLPWHIVNGHLGRYSMELARRTPTVPVLNPNKSIDHIAVKGLTIQATEAVHLKVSDHLALVAEAY